MDPNTIAAATPATTTFVGWITQYGSIVAFVAQIAYWALMIVLIGYAVFQYKRWVNFQLGTGRSGQLRGSINDAGDDADSASTSKKTVSVEEFVE